MKVADHFLWSESLIAMILSFTDAGSFSKIAMQWSLFLRANPTPGSLPLVALPMEKAKVLHDLFCYGIQTVLFFCSNICAVSNLMVIIEVCLSGCCVVVLSISVHAFHSAMYKATYFFYFSISEHVFHWLSEWEQISTDLVYSERCPNQYRFASGKPFYNKHFAVKLKVSLAFAGLVAHTW